jgi:hypothetical protein
MSPAASFSSQEYRKVYQKKYRKILEELFWQGLLLQVANWFTEQNVVLVA